MRTITLAVTGGFGSGKSTATAYFKALGAYTLDCDQIAKELTTNRNSPSSVIPAKAGIQNWTPASAGVTKRGAILRAILKAFGHQVVTKEGSLDRAKLAQIIFSDPTKRRILESILHPAIRQEVIRRLRESTESIRVVEVPLLFETRRDRYSKSWLSQFDASVVVYAKRDTTGQRLKNKGVSSRDFRDRSRNQMLIEVKCRRADFVVDNSRSHQKLRKQIQQIYRACQFVLGTF